MPKINCLISLTFRFFSILKCTVFCALLHIFLCIQWGWFRLNVACQDLLPLFYYPLSMMGNAPSSWVFLAFNFFSLTLTPIKKFLLLYIHAVNSRTGGRDVLFQRLRLFYEVKILNIFADIRNRKMTGSRTKNLVKILEPISKRI